MFVCFSEENYLVRQVATKTADRSLQPSAPPEGVLTPGAWVMLRRGGRSFKGCVTKVEEKDFQARMVGILVETLG